MSVLEQKPNWYFTTDETEESQTDWLVCDSTRGVSYGRQPSREETPIAINPKAVSFEVRRNLGQHFGGGQIALNIPSELQIRGMVDGLKRLLVSNRNVSAPHASGRFQVVVYGVPPSSDSEIHLQHFLKFHIMSAWLNEPFGVAISTDEDTINESYERVETGRSQVVTKEQEIWAQKTVTELIELLGQVETDRRSANIAAAIIENKALPETQEKAVREKLHSFIEATISSHVLADQIALRCAIRKFIFLQEPGDFRGIQWLLDTLPADPADNRLEAIKTLTGFLRYAPPTGVVEAPSLTKYLGERCEKFFDVDLFAYSEVRVIAFQSLMALALLGSSDTERYIEKARAISEGTGKALARRAQDMLTSLSRRKVGSEETHRLLRAMLIPEDERRARLPS